jgi:hypothetical protein
MGLSQITTIQPGGIEIWAETTTAGTPTFSAPRGSFCVVTVSTSAANLYINTNGSTTWEPFFREAVDLDVAVASTDAASNTITAGLWLPVAVTGGGGTNVITLTQVRSGGWRVVDAYIVSGGATAGDVTVQRGSDNAAITNAMVPGNADVVTRATSILLANATIANQGTLKFVTAGATPACTAFVRLEPR